jgi:hypothetical protein
VSKTLIATEPGLPHDTTTNGGDPVLPGRTPIRWWLVLATVAAVVGAAIVFVAVTDMRPAYDAYGWLVWGKQAWHGNLNTNGAPSWKPLTFLFTFPYALAGHTQMWLWMVTAVAGSFAGSVFAARIAFRLVGPSPQAPYAPYLGAVFAGVAVLGLAGYWPLVLISNSDPIIVTLCLAAIDAHLSGRPKLAYAAIVLASLGRPEAWLFTFGYAAWAWWRKVPGMRVLGPACLVAIPIAWFGVPALTAKSWFISGDLALNSKNIIHGSKIVGVFHRFAHLYELPMRIAVLAAIALAAVRRDVRTLSLAAIALAWVLVELAFAFHGWSAVPRYLMEPGAVMVVIVGAEIGRLLAATPRAWSRLNGRVGTIAVRVAAAVAVAAFVVALIPSARDRVRKAHDEIVIQRHAATAMGRLEAVIKRLGGPARIRACGQPVTFVGFQSALAWEIGLNVGYVGYKPGKSIHKGLPIVYFKPHDYGWQVRPIHSSPTDAASCALLRTDTAFG